MSYVIRYVGLAGPMTEDESAELANPGDYLVSFDPDGGPDDTVTGTVEWTPLPSLAQRFDTTAEAISLYLCQSRRVPLRGDGKPNRPLTAVTVSIEPLP